MKGWVKGYYSDMIFVWPALAVLALLSIDIIYLPFDHLPTLWDVIYCSMGAIGPAGSSPSLCISTANWKR